MEIIHQIKKIFGKKHNKIFWRSRRRAKCTCNWIQGLINKTQNSCNNCKQSVNLTNNSAICSSKSVNINYKYFKSEASFCQVTDINTCIKTLITGLLQLFSSCFLFITSCVAFITSCFWLCTSIFVSLTSFILSLVYGIQNNKLGIESQISKTIEDNNQEKTTNNDYYNLKDTLSCSNSSMSFISDALFQRIYCIKDLITILMSRIKTSKHIKHIFNSNTFSRLSLNCAKLQLPKFLIHKFKNLDFKNVVKLQFTKKIFATFTCIAVTFNGAPFAKLQAKTNTRISPILSEEPTLRPVVPNNDLISLIPLDSENMSDSNNVNALSSESLTSKSMPSQSELDDLSKPNPRSEMNEVSLSSLETVKEIDSATLSKPETSVNLEPSEMMLFGASDGEESIYDDESTVPTNGETLGVRGIDGDLVQLVSTDLDSAPNAGEDIVPTTGGVQKDGTNGLGSGLQGASPAKAASPNWWQDEGSTNECIIAMGDKNTINKPKGIGRNTQVTWMSNDEKIATVTSVWETGQVTGVAPGLLRLPRRGFREVKRKQKHTQCMCIKLLLPIIPLLLL